VQPSALLAPFYREAILEDPTLALGSSRQRLAIRAKELNALEKESKKLGYTKPDRASTLRKTAEPVENTQIKISGNFGTKRLNLIDKSLIWIIVALVTILAIYLITPSQKVSSTKSDKALIENLFDGLNKASSAQGQFSYVLSRNYPGFLNAAIARACASGRKPATSNSYTPLLSPESVEFNTIKSIGNKYSTNYAFDGSYGPDNQGFKGTKILGRTYLVTVKDKLSSGGQVYTFDKEVRVTIKDGKAYWYSHYC